LREGLDEPLFDHLVILFRIHLPGVMQNCFRANDENIDRVGSRSEYEHGIALHEIVSGVLGYYKSIVIRISLASVLGQDKLDHQVHFKLPSSRSHDQRCVVNVELQVIVSFEHYVKLSFGYPTIIIDIVSTPYGNKKFSFIRS
jgi:hypothetical protein